MIQKHYLDFDLRIERSGDGFRAEVLDSPAGQASTEFRLPFAQVNLENYLLRLGRTTHAMRRADRSEMQAAKELGGGLFQAAFGGEVMGCFRSSLDEVRRREAGLRVRLRLADAELVDLPWEYLYNSRMNSFIALSEMTPVVRYLDLPARTRPLAVTPPIRVLVMMASPMDYACLDVEREWAKLNESLAPRLDANQIVLERLDHATLRELRQRLRREPVHIFHFVGHGEFDERTEDGVLILEGDHQRGHRVSSQFLGMLLHDHPSMRLVVLNACEGARPGRTDPFAGTAQGLVQQGIPAVIAMQFEIADEVAVTFAQEFYGALADGYPVDTALTASRMGIFATGRDVEWGTPVLYLRAPDGRIFDIASTSEVVTSPPAGRPAPQPLVTTGELSAKKETKEAATDNLAGGKSGFRFLLRWGRLQLSIVATVATALFAAVLVGLPTRAPDSLDRSARTEASPPPVSGPAADVRDRPQPTSQAPPEIGLPHKSTKRPARRTPAVTPAPTSRPQPPPRVSTGDAPAPSPSAPAPATSPSAPAPVSPVLPAPPPPAPTVPPALADVSIEDVLMLVPKDGEFTEVDARVTLGTDRFVVFDLDEERLATRIYYRASGNPSARAISGPVRLVHGDEHWLIVPTSSGRLVLQLDEGIVDRLVEAFEHRSGVRVTRLAGEFEKPPEP